MGTKFICDPEAVYHVYSRCINREWFVQDLNGVWEIFASHLWFVTHAYGLEVQLFVLMSNHFHMLCRAPHANLSQAVGSLLRESSLDIQKSSKRINRVFADRFGRSRITSEVFHQNAYKYIAQNPLRAGMVQRVEDFPYSTINSLLGGGPVHFPVVDPFLFNGLENQIRWLNLRLEDHNEFDIRRALRRRVAKPSKSPSGYQSEIARRVL